MMLRATDERRRGTSADNGPSPSCFWTCSSRLDSGRSLDTFSAAIVGVLQGAFACCLEVGPENGIGTLKRMVSWERS